MVGRPDVTVTEEQRLRVGESLGWAGVGWGVPGVGGGQGGQ
mgnify:CR=1 FL=1